MKNRTNSNRKRISIFLLIFIIIVSMSLIVYGYFKTEYQKKPIIKEKVDNNDLPYLYNFYISTTPQIENRAYFGNTDASIVIINYISFNSDSSKQFIQELFPIIKQNYIDTGKARYYHKNLLNIDDFNEKNENFIYVKSYLCFNSLKKESFGFYIDLFNINNSDEILNLVMHYNVSTDEFNKCMQKKEFNEIIEDVSEVENFGISLSPRIYIGIQGMDNTIIEGIPSERKFQRTIKTYQTLLGD